MKKLFLFSGALALTALVIHFLIASPSEPAPTTATTNPQTATGTIPPHLQEQFSTDWSQTDPRLARVISGGPGKDGIPALDQPTFVPLRDVDYRDSLEVVVLPDRDSVRVYPYNILTWHEIVNDTVNGRPVAITFCPLCGSAIVFDRTLPDGNVATFGVSGSLLESNMIMYDRTTESLWQQSTGRALAGTWHQSELELVPFQLLSFGAVQQAYPDGEILSEDTGFTRDYRRNPYAGYETNDQLMFPTSELDETYEPKTIMVVFRLGETVISVPWLALKERGALTTTIAGQQLNLRFTEAEELTITDETGTNYPFYFEMWFSLAAQHQNPIVLAV